MLKYFKGGFNVADIKTNLREISVAISAGLLIKGISFSKNDLYEPKKLKNLANIIGVDFKNASNIFDVEIYNQDLKDIITNGYNLAYKIVRSAYFHFHKDDQIKWVGFQTQKEDPIDLIIGNYSFSLKEDSFILKNMGLYQFLNDLTGSNYKRGLHVFSCFAQIEYNNWFRYSWDTFVDYLKTNNIWQKEQSRAYIIDKKVILKYGELLSVLPIQISTIDEYLHGTSSLTREKVFSKWINLNLSNDEKYLSLKRACSETAGIKIQNLVNNNYNPINVANFFRIYKNEYYYAKTTDMLYLYDVSVPPFAYNKLLANLGSMQNTGVELGMGITPVQTKDIDLNINVNLTFQQNKLLSLSGTYNGQEMSAPLYTPIADLNGAGFHGGNNHIVYQIVGQPLGVFYLPHCTGLVKQADGSYKYGIADLNGGGVSIEDGEDRYIAGQAMPKAMLGSNISLRYRDFDISLQINGAFGHKIYNGTALSYMNMGSFPDYNVMKGAPELNIKDQTATDYWLEKGDYINFNYLTIGWNIPLGKWQKYFQYIRVSCSVNNLATISAYSGLTPLINSSIVNNTLGIDDKRTYPVYRSYSIGLNFQF